MVGALYGLAKLSPESLFRFVDKVYADVGGRNVH